MPPPNHPPRSRDEFFHFARWHGFPTETLSYMKILLGVLLRFQRRIVIESSVVIYRDDVHYFECLVRMNYLGRPVEVIAGGSTPEGARLNAELFALRQALFGREVPVLGCLLHERRLTVTLDLDPESPLVSDRYELIVAENHEAEEWREPSKLPKPEYRMKAVLQPADHEKRTRYMTITGVPDELKALVAPYMRIGKTIRLHRFILGLQQRYISDLPPPNEMRGELARKLYKDEDLHGHHINGVGYDNRQANIEPLTLRDHRKKHSVWLSDYDDISKGIECRRKVGIAAVIRPAPRVIVTSDHYDMAAMANMAPHPLNEADFTLARCDDSDNVFPATLPHAPPLLRPLGTAELKDLGGRTDKVRNLRYALGALTFTGGQGQLPALQNCRFPRNLHQTTLHRALLVLEGAGVIGSVRLGKSLGKGSPKHYWLRRPLEAELFESIRHELGESQLDR